MFDVFPDIRHVVVICGRSDLRRGIAGLSAMVQLHYGLDPLKPGTMFLFCGVRRDRIKGLVFNGTGFYLLYIRLSNGHFQWPRNSDEARDISPEQYKCNRQVLFHKLEIIIPFTNRQRKRANGQ